MRVNKRPGRTNVARSCGPCCRQRGAQTLQATVAKWAPFSRSLDCFSSAALSPDCPPLAAPSVLLVEDARGNFPLGGRPSEGGRLAQTTWPPMRRHRIDQSILAGPTLSAARPWPLIDSSAFNCRSGWRDEQREEVRGLVAHDRTRLAHANKATMLRGSKKLIINRWARAHAACSQAGLCAA